MTKQNLYLKLKEGGRRGSLKSLLGLKVFNDTRYKIMTIAVDIALFQQIMGSIKTNQQYESVW